MDDQLPEVKNLLPMLAVRPPAECRQQLAADGKPYPRSSCAVCGQFSPRWRECDALLAAAPAPPASEVEVLAVVTLGSFSSEELGEIDVEPQMKTLERIQQQLVTNEDVSLELVDIAHFTRLTAENARLQAAGEVFAKGCEILERKLADAQSELTKARELIAVMTHAELIHERMQAAQDLKNWAHQSAPAAKGDRIIRESLLKENQRITPARFKCLACGEYHEGMSGLPCPNMTPYSQVKP